VPLGYLLSVFNKNSTLEGGWRHVCFDKPYSYSLRVSAWGVIDVRCKNPGRVAAPMLSRVGYYSPSRLAATSVSIKHKVTRMIGQKGWTWGCGGTSVEVFVPGVEATCQKVFFMCCHWHLSTSDLQVAVTSPQTCNWFIATSRLLTLLHGQGGHGLRQFRGARWTIVLRL